MLPQQLEKVLALYAEQTFKSLPVAQRNERARGELNAGLKKEGLKTPTPTLVSQEKKAENAKDEWVLIPYWDN